MLITCPSGLSFQARNWRLGDRAILSDRTSKVPLQRRMLEAVSGPVVSPGPYGELRADQPVNWGHISQSDMGDALISLRIQSKPVYDYDAHCQACGAILHLTQDLSKIPMEAMPADALDHLRSGVPIDRSFAGVDVCLRLPTGADLARTASAKNVYEQIEIADCMHIAAVKAPEGAIVDPLGIRAFYQRQGWQFQAELSDEVRRLEAGRDLRIIIRCDRDNCGIEQELLLPLGPAFFDPALEPRRSAGSPPRVESTSTRSSS